MTHLQNQLIINHHIRMRHYLIKLNIIFVMMITCLQVTSKTLYDISTLAEIEVDSILVTTMPEGLLFSSRVTRDGFEKNASLCNAKLINSQCEINAILTKLLICNIDSVLPYDGKTMCKKLNVHMSRSNKVISSWINDDSVDIRCRAVLFVKDSIIVIWLSDTGIFDADKYRCSGGKDLIRLFRELVYP